MREGNMDKVLKNILKMDEGFRQTIKRDFKGVKPFAQIPMTPQEKILLFDGLGEQDKVAIMQEFGAESFYSLALDIEKLRREQKGAQNA